MMIKFKDLWETEHGSAMWNMFVPGKSDHDRCIVRVLPTESVLMGYRITETWPQTHEIGKDGVEIDTSYIEIEQRPGQRYSVPICYPDGSSTMYQRKQS